MAQLLWNEFAPDLDSISPGNISDMRGFRPTEKGVATADPMSILCSSLPSTCFGAFVQYLLGTQVIILATINGLYLVMGGAPEALGTGFTNTQNRWRAAAYGRDLVIVNGVDPDQYYRLNGAWQASNQYALNALITDSNGNTQTVTTAGVSGLTAPKWATTLNGTTNDGGTGGIEWSLSAIGSAGLSAWQPQTAYTLGQQIADSNGNTQTVIQAGTSGLTMPQWATPVGATTPDNQITWTLSAIGTTGAPAWRSRTKYKVGQSITDSNGNTETAVSTGNSGTVMPKWAIPLGQITVDGKGGVTWTLTTIGTTGALAVLPGNPPVASLVTATDYAVILVPPNSQTLYSNLSDTASWTPNGAAEVYQYTLAQIAGNITSVQRKRSLLAVYRQNAIQCATFVGGLIGWDFGSPGTISQTVGVQANEMVVNTGDVDYFIGPDDFWQFDGYNLNRIPNHVKEWFFGSKGLLGDLNQAFAENTVGHYDNINDLVMWHYPSNSTPRGLAGNIDSVIGFYNRGTPRWFMDRVDLEYALTGPAPNLHGVIQLDHALWVDDESEPFSGVSYVTSQDFGDRTHIFQHRRTMPGFALYPIPQGSDPPARMTPLVQMKVGTTPLAKPSRAISDNGFFNFLSSGRLQRFQLRVYGPCELTQGEVQIEMTGER